MPRSIRFIPEGGALVEVTDRTVQARFLLVPSRELNEIVIGVLGRAQRVVANWPGLIVLPRFRAEYSLVRSNQSPSRR